MTPTSAIWFILATAVPSLLISIVAAALVRKFASKIGLLDEPGDHKTHDRAVPLGGGLAIWAGVVSVFAGGFIGLWMTSQNSSLLEYVPAFAQEHLAGIQASAKPLWTLIGCGTVLMLLGLTDDRKGVSWKLRLIVQFGIASICVFWQGWRLTAFVDLPVVTGLLSVIWIVMLINSFNMLDNMDGLSAGVAAIASTMLGVVMLIYPDPSTGQPQLFVAGFLFVLVGALCGFLFHNRAPARLFMGDAGSYFVGFCVAIATMLATFTGYQAGTQHAIIAPLCVLAVPLYDLVTVLWIRLKEGRSPFVGDNSHFSHRLVKLGLSRTQAVLTIYLVTATCGLGALLLQQVDHIGAGVILLMVVCTLGTIAILEKAAANRDNK